MLRDMVALRPPYDHVIVPLDNSPQARRALSEGKLLADALGATLHLLHAESHWDRRDEGMHGDVQRLSNQFGALATVRTKGVEDRKPEEVVAAFATELGNAVVCMATHGKSGLAGKIFGSTTAALLREFGRPVIVQGPAATPHPVAISRVVAALDGTAFSDQILSEAASWAHDLGVPLWLVEVLDPSAAVRAGATESGTLQADARRLADCGVLLEWETLHGKHVGPTLLDYVNSVPGTLTALATHGRTGIAALLVGSVAEHLVHHCQGPMALQRPAAVG